MTWSIPKPKRQVTRTSNEFLKPDIPQHAVDWARLVCIDFETFYSQDYTLSKLSTSEYVRDPRFKAQMMGIKVGNGKTRIIPHAKIKAELAKINWSTHSLLCHNTQFDGFILSHHYGVHPAFLYDSLSMARGLHSNDIGAGLDEVSIYYGGGGKIEGSLEKTKGVLDWPKALFDETAIYCANDVDEMVRVFRLMLPKMPDDEIHLIDLTCRMFCSPVLKVDIPRVEKELTRELDEREKLMYGAVDPAEYEPEIKTILKTKTERALEGKEREMLIIKRVIGSNEKFVELLRAEGIEPPLKISPAWMKLSKEEKETPEGDAKKYAYAFAKDDEKFLTLPHMTEEWGYDLNDPKEVEQMVAKQVRIQALVDVRLAVKSTTNITRAERFLEAGKDGMSLPVGYAYYRAHTGRWGGNNKMNMQNLTRGGELRLSILAPKGHVLAVQDSGQIECVAHDSPILTRDRGYVRIQDITLTDLLWDGVEWVHHGGVVCTGYKEVITYDGLTATGNHKIWLEDGTTCTLEEISQSTSGQSLAVGGLRGKAVRFMDSAERTASVKGYDQIKVPMWWLPAEVRNSARGFTEWQINTVQKLRWKTVEKLSSAWAQVRCYLAEMQRSDTPELDDIWSTRDQMQLCFPRRVHPLDGGTFTPSRLQGCGNRSSKQQRALRTGQSEVSNTPREREQPEHNRVGSVCWAESATHYIHGATSRMRVWLRHHWGLSAPGANGRTDHPAISHPIQKSFVYDILNAGPRHRFTASDRIVSNCRVNGWLWGQDDLMDDFRAADAGTGRDAYCNFADHVYGREITKADKTERFVGKVCVLGLGFQMGPTKLQITFAKGALGGPPVYFELDKCKAIVNTYRMKNIRIQAGWSVCARIIEDMAEGREGSYGPLNWEANTIWLPNGMSLKYPDLKKSLGDQGWPEWTYQSGAQRKKIYGGLLCLGAKTQVLTDNGWKSIISVRLDDKLWDGANWVSHSGLVHQGIKETISFGGVDMTPDHEVLINDHWFAAEETTHHEATSSFKRHHWAPDRYADSSWSGWQRWSTNSMDSSMPVWQHPSALSYGVRKGQYEELRMLDGSLYIRIKDDTRYVEAPRLRSVAGYARPVQPAKPSSMGPLRRAWNYGMPTMERVRSILGRHASWLQARLGIGSPEQLVGIQPRELPVGNPQGQCWESSFRAAYPDAKWLAAVMAGCRGVWDWEDDVALSTQAPMASSQNVRQPGRQQQDVFDLVNAGPSRRFTVRGDDGLPFIVHNCENVVQALARIIVGWQMLQISRKYRVVMTTHDEVVAMPKTTQADACIKYMAKWMSTPLAWCPDIPLNCEGGHAANYSK